MRVKYWDSPTPEKCEMCGDPIKDEFFDGRTLLGSWAFMCRRCFYQGSGIGRTGPSNGQRYEKQQDNRWKKTEG